MIIGAIIPQLSAKKLPISLTVSKTLFSPSINTSIIPIKSLTALAIRVKPSTVLSINSLKISEFTSPFICFSTGSNAFWHEFAISVILCSNVKLIFSNFLSMLSVAPSKAFLTMSAVIFPSLAISFNFPIGTFI